MKKLTNGLFALIILFFLPIAAAQLFPFSGFSPGNNLPLQQGNYLQLIATYTYGTLQKVNDLPTFIEQWLKVDKTEATANKFPNFVQLGQSAEDPISKAQQITLEMFGKDVPADINDFTYTTLLGKMIQNPDKREGLQQPPEYTFLKTASGGLLKLSRPQPKPGEVDSSIDQYKAVYKTLISAISFNNYAITKLYNDMQRDKDTVDTLVKQTTDSDWLKKLGGELELGVIFRQMLLYTSQSYVLQARMMEMQRQMNMAQLFTNTLLILSIQNGIQLFTASSTS